MKTNAERFVELVPLFRAAIVDAIIAAGTPGADGKVTYVPSTAALRGAAFKAMKELVESEPEPVEPMLAVNVWNAVMLTNESAFHQGLKREIDAGKHPKLKLVAGAKAVAMSYVEG